MSAAELSKSIVRPRALRKGDTVGIVAPSSPLFNRGDLEFTFHWLAKLGLKYKVGRHVFDSYSNYAGSDEVRLNDLHTMWSDSDVAAILPVCGGNGAARLLPGLDFELIAQNPKIIVGYSDLTALILPIHQKTGLVTFHGPMATSFYDSAYTYHYFMKSLMRSKPIGVITDPEVDKIWDPPYPPARMIISEGVARGRLTGGCLTLLRQLMGSPYEIDTAGKLLFIEDLHEEPHNIDRMLSQLLLAGKLQKCTGIVIGDCINCEPGDSNRRVLKLNYSLEEVLRDRLGTLGIPVVYGLKLGHTKDRLTLPIGVVASLEASSNGVFFKIEEAATVG
jgi:muramoyltetrapeptide carboxypeptidase